MHISEAKMTTLGLFLGNLVWLGCSSAIIEFDVLCTLWVFMVDVQLWEKPGCWFALTKCVKSTFGGVTFYVKI